MKHLLFALVLVALPQAAFAQDAADEPAGEPTATERVAWDGNRLSLRFSSAPLMIGYSRDRREHNNLGLAPIIEVEASLTLENQMTFELVGQWLLGQYGYRSHGGAVTARVGYSIPVHGGQTHRSGFLVPLVGYVYAKRPGWESSEGYDLINETHSVEAALAYDFFSGWQNAFTMRALVGFEYVLSSELHNWAYVSSTHMRFGLRAGLLLGMSFRSLGESGTSERARVRPPIRTGGARLSLRFTSSPLRLEFSDRDSNVDHLDIGVAEVSLTLASKWTFEFGMSFMFGRREEATGMSGTGRLGYSIPLAENQSGSVSMFLVPLVGYRYARRPMNQPFGTTNDTHSAQLGAALDLLVGKGSALSLRLFGAYEYAFISEFFFESDPRGYDIGDPMTYSVQAGLLVGYTFRGIGRH